MKPLRNPDSKEVKNPAMYRLDFVKENTFNRIWSIRMTHSRVIIASIASLAAACALIWVCFAYTPLRQFLPGALKGDLRARYLETALRLDSLEQTTAANEAFLSNLMSIMSGEEAAEHLSENLAPRTADTLIAASEAEREFVRRHDDETRFKLSVLAPIAAEGMTFVAPAPPTASHTSLTSGAIAFESPALMPVSAVYRGTVTGIYEAPDGSGQVLTIQHPNNFVSIYSGLSDVFVTRGTRVEAARRIAHTAPGKTMTFELWHNGAALNPEEYIVTSR